MTQSVTTNIKRLMLEHGRPNWRAYALSFAFMVLAAASTGASAYLMRDVINRVFLEKSIEATYFLGAAIIILSILKGVGTFGQQVSLNAVGNRIVADVQMKIFDHMLQQSVPYFARNHSTQFLAQQSFVANSARGALDLVITTLGRNALSVVALTGVMIVQDPKMAFGALVIMPVAVLALRQLVRRVRKIMHNEFTSFTDIMRTTSEAAQGIRVVKAFGLEGHFRDKMRVAVDSFAFSATRLANVSSRSTPIMETLGGFAVAFIVVYGGYQVIYHGQTPGAFFSFITAMLMAYEPFKRLARFNIDFNAQMVGVGMMYDFLDSPSEEPDDSHLPDLKVGSGQIEVRDVTFWYRESDPVLQEIMLVAQAGKSTALVGPSGSGKSTLFGLIQRFYAPKSGTILIDGQDISKVNRASLRRAIGVVSQDTFLFQGTIRENIAMGDASASEAAVMAACKHAHVDDFVREFEHGYETQVGEHGMSLSGGQRQRVAIARALLKGAPIILLDEATSALDPISEQFVRDGLRVLASGRTVLMIAHRKESYAHADTIIEMAAGRVRQAA